MANQNSNLDNLTIQNFQIFKIFKNNSTLINYYSQNLQKAQKETLITKDTANMCSKAITK